MCFHEDTDVLLNNYALLKADQEAVCADWTKRYIAEGKTGRTLRLCLPDRTETVLHRENYPDIVVERGTLDEVIAMMIGGERTVKGLLIKDFQLMKNQGKILIAIFVVIAAFGIFADGNSSFLTAYFTIFVALFTTSTISYDEYDSGYLFLFTLPISRRGYVTEKYVFGILSVLIAWCFGMAVGTAAFLRDNSS